MSSFSNTTASLLSVHSSTSDMSSSRNSSFSNTDGDSLFSHLHKRDGSTSSSSSDASSAPSSPVGSMFLDKIIPVHSLPPHREAGDTSCPVCQSDIESLTPIPSAPAPTIAGRDFPINPTRDMIISHLSPLLSDVHHTKGRPLKIVGLLMSDDPGCAMYSRMTGLSCKKLQVEYEMVDMRAQRDLVALQAEIQRLNGDEDVDGLIFYTPCFGMETDKEIRSWISPRIDVEGFHPSYWSGATRTGPALLSELASPESPLSESPIYPCTPLAIVRALQLQEMYDISAPSGSRLAGKIVTIVNRSDTVGLPLAHMFVNESATVFSVDIASTQIWETHNVELGPCIASTTLTPAEIYARSDIIISAVPSAAFKIPTPAIKPGCIAINVASGINNFEADIKNRAALFTERMGSLTILMLVMNALALRARAVSEAM